MPALLDYLTQLKNTAGSVADISNAVWTAAARTLTADPATSAGLATLVWSHTPRSLTGTGGTLITAANAINQTLAAGATVDLRPAATSFRFCMFGVVGGVSTSWSIGQYDGVTFRPETAIASLGALLELGIIGNGTFGFAVQNTGIITGNYNMSGFDWSQ